MPGTPNQKRNRRSGVEDRWSKTVRTADGRPETAPSAAAGKGLRWRARYVDENGKERAKGFRTKTEATSWLNGIVAAQETGSYIDPSKGKVTFSSYYKEWSGRQVWVSGTRHVMDQAANSATFKDTPLGNLLPSDVEAWIKSMQDDGLQPSTIRTRFANVRAVIRSAVRDRFLARDVADRIRVPRQRKSSAAMRIPSTEEVGAVLRAADERGGWFTAFVAVCAFAGLRRAEACALQVGDVDFLRKELRVDRQVQWTDAGDMEIRGAKYGSERTVFIPDGLVHIIAEHVRLHRPGDDPARWLFPGFQDPCTPVHSARVGRAWRAVRSEVGITHRLHDLRHFYASGLIASGCDVVTVQRALGHASAAETLSTYSHLWPDASDRTRNAAGVLLDQALNPAADALRTQGSKTPAD